MTDTLSKAVDTQALSDYAARVYTCASHQRRVDLLANVISRFLDKSSYEEAFANSSAQKEWGALSDNIKKGVVEYLTQEIEHLLSRKPGLLTEMVAFKAETPLVQGVLQNMSSSIIHTALTRHIYER